MSEKSTRDLELEHLREKIKLLERIIELQDKLNTPVLQPCPAYPIYPTWPPYQPTITWSTDPLSCSAINAQ